MKKRGFTLIELLAVIVVLAIIALIATPIVMNTIKSAKKGSAERGADNYIKQVETAIATSKLDNKDVADGEYPITSDGNLCRDKSISCSDSDKIAIEMNGEKPKSGRVVIKNGQVTTRTLITIGDYGISYDNNSKKYMADELYKGILCKAVTTATDGNLPQGNFVYGDEYTCELGDGEEKIFFVLETNGDNVSLIMNANIDSNGKAITTEDAANKGTVAWISKEDYTAAGGKDLSNDGGSCEYAGFGCYTNEFGPITAENTLKLSTSKWLKLSYSQVTLPTMNQIATASGITFNNEALRDQMPKWLYTNLYDGIYWTSTPGKDYYLAWYCMANFFQVNPVEANYGVRPVITVSKSQLG